MQCLWWFVVLLSVPYKLIVICYAARVPRRPTPDPQRRKNMERGPSSAADGMKVGVIWEEETKESVAWGMEEALIDEGEGGGFGRG